MLMAQLALALSGSDREEILARLVELLAAAVIRDFHNMPHELIAIITSRGRGGPQPLAGRLLPRGRRGRRCWRPAGELDRFRRASENLYERVRAIFFLAAIYRYHLPAKLPADAAAAGALRGLRPPLGPAVRGGGRRFPRRPGAAGPQRRDRQRPGRGLPRPGFSDPGRPGAAERPLGPRQPVDVPHGPSGGPSAGHPPRNLQRAGADGPLPILAERTPVRMDLSHSGWSDIFFLGMDFPEGRRVLNVSVDLGVRGRDAAAAAADRGLSARDRPSRCCGW